MFTKMFSNKDRSNASDYNKKVWCEHCQFEVRQGGHESRCRKNGPSRKERRTRRGTVDSGYGSAGSRLSTESKKNIKKFITNQSIIKEAVIRNYGMPGSSGVKSRENLYAFIIPMCGGKTTMAAKHGFIDIDSCGTSISEREGIENCVKEIVSKQNWALSMINFAKEVDNNLDCLMLTQKTLILVHDETMAQYIGAEVIGGCSLSDNALADAGKGRNKVQMGFADINHHVVRAADSELPVLENVSGVEALVIEACNACGIANGAPGVSEFGAAGYGSSNKKILEGRETSLEVLAGLYAKFKVPVEAVNHQMFLQGVREFQGFGGHADELMRIFSTSAKDVVRLTDRYEEFEANLDTGRDRQLARLKELYGGDRGYLTRISSHWVAVGSISENPELFLRLYRVGKQRWQAVFNKLCAYLQRTRFWGGKRLKASECDKIMDMKYLMKAPGLIQDVRRAQGQVVSNSDLDELVRDAELVDFVEFDEAGFVEKCQNAKGADVEQVAYLTREVQEVSVEDLENMDIASAVSCLLVSKNECPTMDAIWRAGRCDPTEAGLEWVDVLNKANKLPGEVRGKLATMVATLLQHRVCVLGEGSLTDFLKVLQEVVMYGKACLIAGKEHGEPSNVYVQGGESGYCGVSIEGDKWMNYMKDVNADLNNVLWLSSKEVTAMNHVKAMRAMSRSQCLGIRDMVEAGLDQREYLAQAAHVLELNDSEGMIAVINSFAPRNYLRDQYINMRKVMFTSSKDGGMGFRLPKGQVMRTKKQVSYRVTDGMRLPGYDRVEAYKRKKEGSEPTGLSQLNWGKGEQNRPANMKEIAEVGLSCALHAITSCSDHENLRKIVRW